MSKEDKVSHLKDLKTLHYLCKDKIIAFEKAGLHLDLSLDWQDIMELNYLCWEVTHPEFEDKDSAQKKFLKIPIKVSDDLIFYPWTIGSSIWIQDIATPIFKDDQENLMLCIAYALAHANQKEVFQLEDPVEIKNKVRKWARKLVIRQDELDAVWKALLPQQKTNQIEDIKEQNTDTESDYFPIVARLVSEFGNNAEYWLWEESGDVAIGHLEEWNYWKMKEYEAEVKASGQKMNISTPQTVALTNIVRKVEKMKRRILDRQSK